MKNNVENYQGPMVTELLDLILLEDIGVKKKNNSNNKKRELASNRLACAILCLATKIEQ